MHKRFLISGLIVALVSVCFAIAAIIFTNVNYPKHISGRLVFPQTVKNGLEFNKAILTSPQGKITLVLENNYWVVSEADYYYAGIDVVNDLFSKINTATYYSQKPYSSEALSEDNLLNPLSTKENAGTLIETFINTQPLDSIIIGKQASNEAYSFARPIDKNEIWLIDADFNLAPEVYSWLMQPILDYPTEIIEKVIINNGDNNDIVMRPEAELPFLNPALKQINPNALLERFNFLITEEVKSAQNFDEKLFPEYRTITFVTFSGLITKIHLFHNNNDYWIKISLSTTNLPTAAVNAYIRDNTFLYDGWYFKIPASAGRVMANYNLI